MPNDVEGEINRLREELARESAARARAEDELRKLSSAIDQSPATVVITDARGIIEYVNPKFTQLTGYTAEEAVGKSPKMLKSGHTPPEEYRGMWEALSQGREWRGQFCNRKKNGELYWELASISPVRDSAGVVTHFVAVKEDVTEQRWLQEQRDDYLRALSHDLRNPLTSILGQAQVQLRLLDRMDEGSRLRQAAQAIATSARHMDAMIQQLTEAARVEARNIPLRLGPVDLPAFAREVRTRIGDPGDAERIEVVAEEGVPMALADPSHLERVMRNLISNALKYSPGDSKVAVTITTDKGRVLTRVADQGEGIPPEDLRLLFQRYFRTKAARAHRDGLGLGLYLTKGLIEAHGGAIWAESEVGKGSTFSFTLPAVS